MEWWNLETDHDRAGGEPLGNDYNGMSLRRQIYRAYANLGRSEELRVTMCVMIWPVRPEWLHFRQTSCRLSASSLSGGVGEVMAGLEVVCKRKVHHRPISIQSDL